MGEIIHTKVAGHRYHQRACQQVTAGQILTLKREPKNRHDPDAVAVHAKGAGKLGYLPGGLAFQVAPYLDSGKQCTCKVLNTWGGTEKRPTVGVRLALEFAEDLPERQKEDDDFEDEEEVIERNHLGGLTARTQTAFPSWGWRAIRWLIGIVVVVWALRACSG